MAEKIKLVKDDTLPQIKVTFTDETTGLPIDITGATPRLRFRAVGSTTLIATLTGTVLDGPNGICIFAWGQTTLGVDAGDYEGEVEVTFVTGAVQTVYDILKFKVREDF
jgi:hypothetical protein